MTVAVCANSQDYFRPYIDTLIYLAYRARSCDTLVTAQSIEINALTAQTIHQGTVISLQTQKIEAGEALAMELQKQMASYEVIYREQKAKLKHKIRTLWKWVIVEGATILVLVVMLI